MGGEDANGKKSDSRQPPGSSYPEKKDGMKLWGILIFGVIGATATTFAVSSSFSFSFFSHYNLPFLIKCGYFLCSVIAVNWILKVKACNFTGARMHPTSMVSQLRRTVDWFYVQLTRSQSSFKGGKAGSFRSAFQEEAYRRYNRRMQEEYEEEMERVERIRRMQSVFNRERNKHRRGYESWKETEGGYHQHFQRDDWYWKTDTSFRDHSNNNFRRPPRDNMPPMMSHHYSVLGLDRSRTTAYTDAEIKVTTLPSYS
ncbi:unnamed protein product [Linum tenue]|uniref:Uncharacterized protein n=1 Tax=Linum tenue TaxID=586396 RepID=A0AAV0P1Y1_9ROSI|nr:unnamed protein product [Linum tenue]